MFRADASSLASSSVYRYSSRSSTDNSAKLTTNLGPIRWGHPTQQVCATTESTEESGDPPWSGDDCCRPSCGMLLQSVSRKSGKPLTYRILPEFTWLECFVVAGCLAPTDPVLAASVVKGTFAERHVPPYVRDILLVSCSELTESDDNSVNLLSTMEQGHHTGFYPWC